MATKKSSKKGTIGAIYDKTKESAPKPKADSKSVSVSAGNGKGRTAKDIAAKAASKAKNAISKPASKAGKLSAKG